MKAYVKPELYVERFELAQHIAGCGAPLNHDNGATCTIKPGPLYGDALNGWFASVNHNCSQPVENWETYGYTNQDTSFGLFTS